MIGSDYDPPAFRAATEHAEAGYALVAAVASIAFFSLIALGVLTATQRVLVTGSAEIEQAEAAAAADAGIALAVHGLLSNDLTNSWPIDGRVRRVAFERARLSIRIVDERGKIPLNLIEQEQLTAMLETAGLVDGPLRIARDSMLDWIDDDDEPRAEGAETGFYRAQAIQPRNAPLLTVSELGRIRGFSPGVVARLQPIVSVDFGSGSFDTRFAQPKAIGVMYGGGDSSPEAIQRAREAAGQVTALGFVGEAELVARPLSIEVEANLRSGAKARRRCVVELTGSDVRPYVVRNCE